MRNHDYLKDGSIAFRKVKRLSKPTDGKRGNAVRKVKAAILAPDLSYLGTYTLFYEESTMAMNGPGL